MGTSNIILRLMEESIKEIGKMGNKIKLYEQGGADK